MTSGLVVSLVIAIALPQPSSSTRTTLPSIDGTAGCSITGSSVPSSARSSSARWLASG